MKDEAIRQGPDGAVESPVESPVDFPVESVAELVGRVRKEARARNVRWTNQRQSIVEMFIGCREHVTAEDLHQRVREVDPTVSTATVYRTINLLVEIGAAVKRDFGTGTASFEPIMSKHHHHHLINMQTGEVIEFVNEELEAIKERIAHELGFKLVHHQLELFGVPLDADDEGDLAEGQSENIKDSIQASGEST